MLGVIRIGLELGTPEYGVPLIQLAKCTVRAKQIVLLFILLRVVIVVVENYVVVVLRFEHKCLELFENISAELGRAGRVSQSPDG